MNMWDNEAKLESIAETVIAIPFGGSDDEDDFEDERDVQDEAAKWTSFPCRMYTPPEVAYRDLPEGPRLRMKAYEDAFARCRNRVQEVLRKLHSPTTARIIDAVQDAYCFREEDRLMPYTELHTIAISGTDRSATSALLEDVQRVLTESEFRSGEDDEAEDGSGMKTPVVVSTLTPTDCSNLTSTMKAMIGGFLDSNVDDTEIQEEEGESNRLLASYDIKLLEMWYDKLKRYKNEADLPKLVVLVTDLEQIEPAIMQDLFYICSLHNPRLPLVFILGLSTPPTPSYLHTAFPRKTRALLHVTRVEVAGGLDVLERVLNETFFDPEFEPTIMLSPPVLSFLLEQFVRTTQSINFVVTLLQLVHLRHFVDPLSVLANDELLGMTSIEDAAERLSEPASRPFLLALLARLQHSTKFTGKTGNECIENGNETNGNFTGASPEKSPRKGKGKAGAANGILSDAKWLATTPLDALLRVRTLRKEHEWRSRRARVAFCMVSAVRRRLLGAGVLRIGTGGRGIGTTIGTEVDMMGACLRGTLAGREAKVLASGIRRLDTESLSVLLSALCALMHGLPVDIRAAEKSAMVSLVKWTSALDALAAEEDAGDIAEEVSEWLIDYISENTRDFTGTALWDIWYTGNPTGLVDMFNPAPRTALINALVHPERYLGNEDAYTLRRQIPTKGKGKRVADNIADGADARDLVPDTALLFKGYLESGRMVNVYDWYASFKEGLDARRRAARAVERRSRPRTRGKKNPRKAAKGSTPPSPTKARGRRRRRGTIGRGRGARGAVARLQPDAESESDEAGGDDDSEIGENEDDLSPEERERWEMEAQARFIRSLQELDMLGFVKHTGRKADHVHKTVYELPEYR